MRRLLLILAFLCTALPAFAQHPAHPEVVASVKADLEAHGGNLSGPCGAFAITKRVAWLLKAEGVGLLSKPGGNNCDGYSTDYLVYQDGVGVDILQDGGGANGPTWQADFDAALLGRWRAPVDPGDSPQPPVVVPPPIVVPPVSEGVILARLDRIEAKIDANEAKAEAFRQSVADKWKKFGLFVAKYGPALVGSVYLGRALK